jgi:hypothetical protein
MRIAPLLFIKLEFILLLVIIPVVILLIISLLYYVYKDLKTRSTNLYQYKITNFFYNFTIIGLYIIFFIFIIYGTRIMYIYINKTLDLKVLYKTLYNTLLQFIKLHFLFQVYYIILLILLLLFILFLLANIQLLCYNEFFKLHIYLSNTNPSIPGYKSLYRVKYDDICSWIGSIQSNTTDIISGYIMHLMFNLNRNILKNCYIKVSNLERIFYYILGNKYYKLMRRIEKIIIIILLDIIHKIFVSKYYKWLFHLSPLLVIVYDCYFNNWILVNIFYFMIVYTPLVILKRLGDSTYSLCSYSITFFRQFYYENEYDHDKYMVCIPKELKELFIDGYLLRGLKCNLDLDFGFVEYNYVYLIVNKGFVPDNYHPEYYDPNKYRNLEATIIIKKSDNKFYFMLYEYERGQYELGDEWIVLEDKYNIEKPWIKVEYEKEEEEEITIEEIKEMNIESWVNDVLRKTQEKALVSNTKHE